MAGYRPGSRVIGCLGPLGGFSITLIGMAAARAAVAHASCACECGWIQTSARLQWLGSCVRSPCPPQLRARGGAQEPRSRRKGAPERRRQGGEGLGCWPGLRAWAEGLG
jgi:hypothetical protein